jgi:putative tryptophan/tyrosine transport system substrate-binding protein
VSVRRREFIALVGGLVVCNPAARAQRSSRLRRLGMLERTSAATNAPNLDGLRQGLRDLGHSEGENYVIEYRSVDGIDALFANLAAELVRLNVDLILTRGTPAALAAKNATATIPVIMVGVGDPVGQGIVASLARPGGNVTGLSALVTDLYAKRVQLVRELVPGAVRIAALFNMSNPAIPPQWREVERTAQSLAMEPQLLDVRTPDDLGRAFASASAKGTDALIVGLETLTQANQRIIVDLAIRHRLPAIYASKEFIGGLLTYGVSYPDQYRRAASFVDKVLKGANPAELPVEQPTKLELVINLKTAKALNLTIPAVLLARADEVIE